MTTTETPAPTGTQASRLAACSFISSISAALLLIGVGVGLASGWINSPVRIAGCSVAAVLLALSFVCNFRAERTDRA